MKMKVGMLVATLLLAAPAFSPALQAAEFTDGKQYTTFDKPAAAKPQALEFFSFYCPHCYAFEYDYGLPAKIESALPKDGEFIQYHVDFLGPLGPDLTRAWAVAMALGVEKQIQPVLFNGIQKTRTINSVADIRNAFLQIGVSAQEYDSALNSFMVNALVAKQQQAAQAYELRGVPTVIIDGKYQINMGGLPADSTEQFIQSYDGVVKFLLQQPRA